MTPEPRVAAFSQAVKDRRELLGLSVDELAKKLGMSKRTVFRFQASGLPELAKLFRVADALKIDLCNLIAEAEGRRWRRETPQGAQWHGITSFAAEGGQP